MIGKNLKAKKRIGFSSFKNNILLHKKIPDLPFEHYSERIYSLLDGLDECKQRIKRVSSREIEPFYKDWNRKSYTVLNIESIDGKLNEEWIDLINLFQNEKIVLMASDFNAEEAKRLLNDYIKKCSKKNEYKVFDQSETINFGKLASFCKCFVSSDSGFIQYASYCGAQIFHLNRKDGDYFDNRYFLGDTVRCSETDSYYKDGDEFHYGKFFDEVLNYINPKITE
jgi:ADP-heptose:LPS heptosyltransferase